LISDLLEAQWRKKLAGIKRVWIITEDLSSGLQLFAIYVERNICAICTGLVVGTLSKGSIAQSARDIYQEWHRSNNENGKYDPGINTNEKYFEIP
jgi:hypothetical protein